MEESVPVWKSYRPTKVTWFSLDQVFHLLVIAGVAWLWGANNAWHMPFGIEVKHVVVVVAILLCWRPSNLFIKLVAHLRPAISPDMQVLELQRQFVAMQWERWFNRAIVRGVSQIVIPFF